MSPRNVFSGSIPTLETARLTLQGHRLDDFGESAAMWADSVVTRYLGGRPFSEEEVWSRLLRYVGHWTLLGFGYWVVREKGSDRFVGEVGFADFRRDLRPSIAGLPELGWVLATWSHGRGYATEAAHAALAWGQTHFEPTRTTCLIHPDNTLSLRVAHKCGYLPVDRTIYKDQPILLLDRPIGSRSSSGNEDEGESRNEHSSL